MYIKNKEMFFLFCKQSGGGAAQDEGVLHGVRDQKAMWTHCTESYKLSLLDIKMKAALIAATVLTLVCSLHKASSLGKLNLPVVLLPYVPSSTGVKVNFDHSELLSRLLLLVSVPTVCVCVGEGGYWCKL